MVCQRTIKNSESLWHSINLNFYEVCLIIGLNHFEPEMIRNGLIFEKHGGAGPSNGIHWMRLNFRGMISGFVIMNINSIILGMFISESHEYLRRILEVLAGLFSMTWWNPLSPFRQALGESKRGGLRGLHTAPPCAMRNRKSSAISCGAQALEWKTRAAPQAMAKLLRIIHHHPTWPSKCPSHSHATQKSLENMIYINWQQLSVGQLLCNVFFNAFPCVCSSHAKSYSPRSRCRLAGGTLSSYPESHCPYINISHH